MKKVNTALIGFGSGARVYNAPIIASVEGFRVHSIMTSNPKNQKAAKEDFPDARIITDYSDALRDKEIELFVICLPNHLHFDFAEKALMAGKNVILEKPFTVSTEQADKLIELSKEKELLLSVHHNRRWDSDILTIQKLLNEEKLGKVVEYEAHFDRFRNFIKEGWKEEKEIPGSGILYDLGSHLIDQALLLFGKPKEVFAVLQKQRENSQVTDNFELLLLYPELKVTLKAGMLVKEPGPRYKLFGRKGNFTKFGMDVQEEALKNGEKPGNNPTWGKEPEEIWGKLNTIDGISTYESVPGDYRKLYQNIYQALTEQEELHVKPEEARDVIRIIELAKKSHTEKRIVEFL